jgi:hypothetical protein
MHRAELRPMGPSVSRQARLVRRMIRRTLELAGRALAVILPFLSYILAVAGMASLRCEGKPSARRGVRDDFSELGWDADHLLWLRGAVVTRSAPADRIYEVSHGS